MTITYSSKGIVLGHLWGGGKGGYKARPINGKTKLNELIIEAKKMLADGSLDGGMGFECLTGAVLIIDKVEKRMIKGKEFINTQRIEKFLSNGNKQLSDTEKNQLLDWYYGM
jgi:hypothetical protein